MAINDGLNHTTNFTYDALGRIKTEQDAMMNVSTYMYDAGGNRTGLLDANGYTTNFQYDSLNRIQTIDYPAPDSDVTYTYNAAGLRQTMIDGSGTTSWEYDGLYRPIAVNNPFDHTVQYTYNSAGNRTSLTYPDMRSVSYDYDQAGRIASVIDWNSGITNYGYDKAGQPATIDLPNGINTSYTFDDAGRLLQKTNQSASELLSSFEYTYDNRGNRTQVVETTKLAVAPSSDLLFSDGFESGDLSAWLERPIDQGDLVVNPAAAMTGTFGMQAIIDDNNPLPVMNCSPVSETRYKAGFQFDPNSISMASGDALYLFEGTDSSNWIKLQLEFRYYRSEYQIRVSTIDDSSHWINTSWYAISDQPHSLEFEWKAATAPGARNGTLQLWIDGTSKQTVTRLDNDTARLDQVKLGAVSEIDNGTRGSLYFDNFTSYRSQPWGSDPVVKTINYKYDQLDRLYEANYSDGILFVYYYDDVGNRTMERIQNNVTTYAYDSANRPTTVGYVNYSWDNNGNLLSDGVNTFTYDHANHLTTVTNQQSGVTLSFTYNGLGDRVSSTVNGVTTNYTLDLAAGLTQVLQDNTDTYIYGNERISQESTSGMEYFLSDAQGSVRQLVVGTGTVNLTKTYRPYGSQLDRIGNAQSSYDFTGEWRDRSPNLIYLRSRYYSPYIGRFLTKDIWPGNDKEPMSNNRWIYGYDNPVNLIDPSGRFPVWCQSMPTAGLYEACVLAYYQLEPLEYYLIGSSITGQKGCYQGKIAYRAPGYLEGIGGFVTAIWGGTERVYDFATMESESFNYRGQGISDAVLGIGVSFYNGWVLGFRSDQSPRGVEIDYQGPFTVGQVGIGLDVGIGIGAGLYGFRSTSDPFVRGTTWYVGVSLSLDFLEGIDIGAANLNYTPINNSYHSYALSSGKVNKSELLSDIMNGSGSPLPPFVFSNRPLYALLALNYTRAYEEIRNAK